jgi:hypothetical protein
MTVLILCSVFLSRYSCSRPHPADASSSSCPLYCKTCVSHLVGGNRFIVNRRKTIRTFVRDLETLVAAIQKQHTAASGLRPPRHGAPTAPRDSSVQACASHGTWAMCGLDVELSRRSETSRARCPVQGKRRLACVILSFSFAPWAASRIYGTFHTLPLEDDD